MKALTLNKLAIACTLALGLTACGGGSDGGSTGTTAQPNNPTNQNNTGNQTTPSNPANPTTPANPNTSANDLAKAKDLINTAKTFVTDSKTISQAYENASEILTRSQGDRLTTAIDIPTVLQKWMMENNYTSLTAQQIKAMSTRPADDDDIYDSLYGELDHAKLEPSNDFSVRMDNLGNLTLTGSLVVKQDIVDYEWDNQNYTVVPVVQGTDTYHIVYKNFTLKLHSGNSKNYAGIFGFDEIKVGTGADAVTLTTKANLNATFNKNVNVGKDFDLSDKQEKDGLRVQSATATLANLTLKTSADTIAVNSLEIKLLDIENTVYGEKVVQTLPYSFKLNGKLTRQQPKTDVTLTLNLVANESDVKNTLEVIEDGVREKSGRYLPATALLTMKGTIAKVNNANNVVTIPLDFQAHLARSATDKIELKNLTANIDNKILNVTGGVMLNQDLEEGKQTFTFSQQGGASLTIHVNEDDELVKTGNKIADIMVNGKDYGDLLDNNGKVTAKFSDNTTIAL